MRKTLIVTVIMMLMAVASALAGTTVSSASASVTGPDGMERNAAMSQQYGMDVFTDPSMTMIIALGEAPADNSADMREIAKAIAKGKGYDTDVTVVDAEGTPVYTAMSADALTSIGVARHPSNGRMVVVMVIQAPDAARAVSAPVMSTLRWK